jgi:methyl-accepting chemotaxis protein
MDMRQRKTYFIMKGMQTKLILVIMLLFFLVTIITVFNVYILTQFFKAKVLEEKGFRSEELDDIIHRVFSEMKSKIFLLIIVDLVVIIMVGIIFSHQIAGPAFKLERCMRDIAGGDLYIQTKLRKGDHLSNLADAFNAMARTLQGNLITVVERFEVLEKAMDKKQLADLNGQLEELRGALSAFRLQKPEEQPAANEEAESAGAES